MMNAYEAGFAKAVQCLKSETMSDPENDEETTGEIDTLEEMRKKCWEEWGQFGIKDYDPRDDKEAKDSPSRGRGRPPATPSPKNPPDSPDLAEAPFNVECCRGRKWMSKGDARGLGRQCVKVKVDGGDLCVDCLVRRDDMSKDFWGYYDEPLGSDCEHTKDGKRGNRHAWKELKDQRAAEKDSEKDEKKKKKLEEMKEKKEKKEKEMKEKKEEKKEKDKKEKKEKKKKEKKEKKVEKEGGEEKEKKEEKEEKDEENQVEIVQGENAEGNKYEVEIHHHSPRDDESTQSLDDDENDYKEEKPDENFIEHIVDGVPLKWNKLTNDLLDPDDDMVMGKMELKEDGSFVAVINDDDSDSDSDDGSDDDSD